MECPKSLLQKTLPILAADYKNESEVGEALAEAFEAGLVKREDLFITTKAISCYFLLGFQVGILSELMSDFFMVFAALELGPWTCC